MSRIFATFDGFCEQIVSRAVDVTCYFCSHRLGKRCMLGSGILCLKCSPKGRVNLNNNIASWSFSKRHCLLVT